jgi:hypothetical protein
VVKNAELNGHSRLCREGLQVRQGRLLQTISNGDASQLEKSDADAVSITITFKPSHSA